MLTLSQTFIIAEMAKNHARQHIKKGCTQIENNNLSKASFHSLVKGTGRGVQDLILKKLNKPVTYSGLETNPMLIMYEAIISVTSKFSLGNCSELATQALDYVLCFSPVKVNAELYLIHGGDHAFLILNRDPVSHETDPSTWGPNAVICDPWANKVFKAADYTRELKNYVRGNGQNHTEDFDPRRHSLHPYEYFNTQSLQRIRTTTQLLSNFVTELNFLISAINRFKETLRIEASRLQKKYGATDQKTLILSAKINEIEQANNTFNTNAGLLITHCSQLDYRSARSSLHSALKNAYTCTIRIMAFSQQEQLILFRHKGGDKKTDVLKFFGAKTKTQNHLEDISEKVNASLRYRQKPHR